MNDLIKVNYESDKPTVMGRDLHEFLEVESNYTTWFKRMTEYGFVENIDFVTCFPKKESGLNGGQNKQDHQLTIEMAKEICMLQRNEKGKIARQYFINLEKMWNSPEMVKNRALKMMNAELLQLQGEVNKLSVQNAIMQPKAEYFDELVDRNMLTNFRDTAKELLIKERDFISFLINKKFLYRDKKGKLNAYSVHIQNGLFELKESYNEKTDWKGSQTLVTPKGRETFRLLAKSN